MSERLMMSEEECRKKIKELLQMPKEDLLTKYMFQEQEIERLNNLVDSTTQLYLKELSEKGKVDDLACKMFNTLEENIK